MSLQSTDLDDVSIEAEKSKIALPEEAQAGTKLCAKFSLQDNINRIVTMLRSLSFSCNVSYCHCRGSAGVA